MNKPSLKVTKWLGNIPVEGVCACCADAQFRPSWNHRRPDKTACEEKMKREFDRHFREVHTREDGSQSAPRIVREATEGN
jgi:hypothetical protein